MGVSIPVLGVRDLIEGGDPGQAYANLLINTYDASEVWRLTDIESGTTIPAQVSSARNGTLTGWTLQSGTSPVTGESLKAPLSDGANDYGNIQTANLTSLFDGAEGGLFGWARVSSGSVWTDNTERFLIYYYVDANNHIFVRKRTANDVQYRYIAGGTNKQGTNAAAFTPTDCFSYALTWSASAGASGEVKFYLNGAQQGATATGLGTWAGSLTSSLIGAETVTPTMVWDGWPAYYALWAGSVPSGAQIAAMHTGVS